MIYVVLLLLSGMVLVLWGLLQRERRSTQGQMAQLKAVTASMPEFIWLKDPDGVFLMCNARFETLFGAAESEIVGKTDYEFVDQELADSFRENDLLAMRSDGPVVNEEVVEYAGPGEGLLLETIKTPLFDESGTLLGVLGIARDISERQQSAQALRAAHQQLQEVLSAASLVSIIATDPAGLITIFNAGAERMLGYSAAEMVGLQTPELIHKREEVERRSEMLSLELGRSISGFETFVVNAREGGFDEREWTYIHKDGHEIDVLLRVTAIENADGTIGFLGVGTDISERKRAERKVRDSQRMMREVIETIPVRVSSGKI